MNKTYTIKDLERITNIKAHTIRIWEKRYNILSPKRTETNIRYYDEQQVKKLLMIVILYRNGMKISEIAKLPLHRLQEIVLSFKLTSEAQSLVIEQLMLAITDFNQEFLEQIIIDEVINKGIEEAAEKVIFPFLKKVGLLWLTDVATCAQMNFAHNQITRILWQNLKFKNIEKGDCYLTFAPTENYIMPALTYLTFLLNRYDKQVTYLGTVNYIDDILESGKFKDCTLVSVYSIVDKEFYEPLKLAQQKIILLDLYNDLKTFDSPNTTLIKNFSEFKELIKK